MKLNSAPIDESLRSAASVVMLRDAPQGLEVFLIKRHGLSDVWSNVYVFPGGKVDLADASLDGRSHLDASGPALHLALNEPELDEGAATALHVAAVREALEETGVLYAQGVNADAASRAWALLHEGKTFDQVLAAMTLRLEVSRLKPWSRWITPAISGVKRKRFDTRFFLAPLPAGQAARHDNHEATDSVWLSPADALRLYGDGKIELAPPQIMSLSHLSRHRSVQAALAEACGRKPPTIRPEHFELEGTRVICYPGDERHSVRDRALPGPTRLHLRDRRYEPTEGFEALFGSSA